MRKFKKRYIVLIVALAVLFLLNLPEQKIQYPEHHKSSITFILIDGLEKENFKALLNNGQIPNISKSLHSGLYVKNGIGSFPSMTGYAFYPFLTGVDAVKSGVLGLRWLDRTKSKGQFRNYVGRTNIHMNKDLESQYPTLFELKDSFYTASVNSYMTKGVHDERKTGWAMTTSKYQDHAIVKTINAIPYFGNQWTYTHYQHESHVAQNALEQLQHNPAVQWITFASPDAYAHINGMDSEYRNIIIHIDQLIGDMISESKALNQSRYFAIITDHGLENVNKNVCLEDSLSHDLGINLKRGDSTNLLFSSLDDDIKEEDTDGYFIINGNLLASIYLKDIPNNSWEKVLTKNELINYKKDKSYNLIDYFKSKSSVEMVMYRIDDTTIGVANAKGEAIIKKQDNKYAYQVVNSDPFNYSEINNLKLDSFYSKENWLMLTADSEYPDAIFRTFELVTHPKSGDLTLCSSRGVDFAKDYEILVKNYKGGHGGIRSEMLNVSYILTGPDITHQTVHAARSEDFGATIFDYLNIDQDVEGNSLRHTSSTKKLQN